VARAPEEREDHQGHERDRDQQGALHVEERGANRRRPVEDHLEVDRRGGRGLELRQQRVDAVDRLDDVGAGLAEDDQQHGGLAVRQADRPDVFDRVLDPRHVLEPHGLAVPVGDDHRHVVRGMAHLVVGEDLRRPGGVAQRALRAIDVRGGQHLANVLERDPVLVERRGVELDADRRQRASADDDLPDAAHLRELLL